MVGGERVEEESEERSEERREDREWGERERCNGGWEGKK